MSASHSVRERISIHAPRAGGDDNGNNKTTPSSDFNPRPPCGGRRLRYCTQTAWKKFQSTPPVRGATVAILYADGVEKISIHAPRAGGDTNATGGSFKLLNISIHAPRAGGDVWRPAQPVIGKEISIHAPRAGGDGWRDANKELPKISIHAPRAGGDGAPVVGEAFSRLFQSTPPVRGATP